MPTIDSEIVTQKILASSHEFCEVRPAKAASARTKTAVKAASRVAAKPVVRRTAPEITTRVRTVHAAPCEMAA